MDEKNIRLQQEVKECAHSMGRWYRFFAVVYIVLGALMLAGGLVMVAAGAWLDELVEYPMPFWVLGVLYIAISAIYVPMIISLFKASSACREAVGLNNNDAAARFMHHSKQYWKYIGILTIVSLGLTVLIFIGAFVYGAASVM